MDLDHALQESMAAMMAERGEWRAEF